MRSLTGFVACVVIALAAACVPPPAGSSTTSGASGSRDPSDLQTAEAILREVEARQWDGESRHTITTDLAKERAAIEQSKVDLAAIRPTFETKVWNEPAAKIKVELRARWRAEQSYLGAAEGYLALLEAKAAAEASPTEANLRALAAAIDLAKRSVWREDKHAEVDGFFRGTVEATADAAKSYIASTPSVESKDRRGAATATQIALKDEGVTNTQLTIADARVGAIVVLDAGTLTTVRVRLVDPAGSSKHALVDCPANATDADKCPRIEFINGVAEVAVQDKRELRVRGPAGPIYLQVIAKDARYMLSALAVGAPAADATLAERDADRWGLHHLFIPSELTWRDARDLFTALPRSFVVYAKTEIPVVAKSPNSETKTRIAAGEPLVILGHALLRMNGERVNVNYTDAERRMLESSGKYRFDGLVTSERPAKLALPAARPASVPDFHVLEYLTNADTWEFRNLDDKRVTAYLTARKPIVSCIDAEKRKQGSGAGLDVVTYDAKGQVKSVKSLSKVMNQRLVDKCKVKGLVAKLEALRKVVRGDALQAIRKHLEQ